MATLLALAFVWKQIREAEPAVAALAVVGGSSLALLATKISKAFYKTFFRPAKDLKKLGNWAIVTGATDGIGKAYALALAKDKGLNVLLISRTEAKLQEVQKEIQEKCAGKDIEVKYVVCDYSQFNQEAQTKVKTAVQELDSVAVLINNVGVSYRYPLFYHELSAKEAENLIEMNVQSTTLMTRMVLPGMLEQKSGAIVNISSGSAMYTLPLLAGYSAAKSYIEKFSRAINAEYAAKGVTCQCQIPFYVATKLAKMRKSFMVPTPDEYVKLGIGWIGYADSAVCSPFWPHALQGWFLELLPDAVVSKIIMNMHLATRKRGLKKDKRLADEAEGKKDK